MARRRVGATTGLRVVRRRSGPSRRRAAGVGSVRILRLARPVDFERGYEEIDHNHPPPGVLPWLAPPKFRSPRI
jgi:hypothetical protein